MCVRPSCFKLWLWNAKAISAAVTFLYCISIFTVASVVAYLCLEEGRKIKIAVLVVSGAYSLSMTWYVAMVGMDIPDPFSKVNNDAKPEADAEP